MKQRYRGGAAAERLAASRSSPKALPADEIAATREICEQFSGGAHEGKGVPAVAAKIGTPPAVLYNKTSGTDSHHKLTTRDMKLIYLATGRIEHLQALARTMNCVAFPVPDFSKCSDQALLELVAKVHKEGGDYHRVLLEALQRNGIDTAELAKLDKEVFEWVGAIVEAHARVKGLARV